MTALIRWGRYDKYEGPYYGGSLKYDLPSQPDFGDKALAVITATEGGCYDAINMYDRCILSVGLIQWCEAAPIFSVSKMLGKCADADKFLWDRVWATFPNKETTFEKNAKGEWRFFYSGAEVTTKEMQRHVFFGGSGTGELRTWTVDSTAYAKEIAAWFASVWQFPLFRTMQREFTKSRLESFVMDDPKLIDAKDILFKKREVECWTGWSGALRAAYLSFAANLPAVANKSIIKASQHKDWGSDIGDKCRIALQHLTFGPGISIYPQRYEAIAPVINRLFGIWLPLSAQGLRDWADAPPAEAAHEYSAEELAQFERIIRLSDDTRMGRNVGLDTLDHLNGTGVS